MRICSIQTPFATPSQLCATPDVEVRKLPFVVCERVRNTHFRADIRTNGSEKENARSSSGHLKRWGENMPRNHVQAGKPRSLFSFAEHSWLRRESSRYFADPQRVYPTLSGRTGLERCNVTQQVFSAPF